MTHGPRIFRIALALSFSLGLGLTTQALAGNAVTHETRFIGRVGGHLILADLNDPNLQVTVETARGFPHGGESFYSLVHRTQPTAAVTGTYFHVRTYWPAGDIVANGEAKVITGMFGNALAVTAYNRADVRPVRAGRLSGWAAFETVLAAGPRLVRNGQVAVGYVDEPDRYDAHVRGIASRTAVGVTADSKLILYATREGISLGNLARIMKALGAQQAMNLDGGTSTAMYYDGRFLLTPGRPLVNVLAVHEGVSLLDRPMPPYGPLSPQDRDHYDNWRRSKAAEHYSAATRLLVSGEIGRAALHSERAVQAEPEHAAYYQFLAEMLLREERPKAAAAALARGGRVLMGKEQYELAAGYLERALKLNPLDAETHEALSRAYGNLGDARRASREAIQTKVARLQREPLPLDPISAPAWLAQAPLTPGRLDGVVLADLYLDAHHNLRLRLPEGMRFLPSRRADSLLLDNPLRGYSILVSLLQQQPPWSLQWPARAYPVYQSLDAPAFGGVTWLESEQIAGRPIVAQQRLFRDGRFLLVFTLVADEKLYLAAKQDCDVLIERTLNARPRSLDPVADPTLI